MYARVARWQGMDNDAVTRFVRMIEAEDGPPEGVPSTGIMVLNESSGDQALVIGLFATEEDMRAGDAVLRAMDRPPDAQGEITSIEFYEVATERRMG